MQLTAVEIDIGTRTPTVLLNSTDAGELGVRPLDRVRIQHGEQVATGIVEVTDELVSPGDLGVTRQIDHIVGTVDLTIARKPTSVSSLTRKLEDVGLEVSEIEVIVHDVNHDRLNDVELSAFVAGVFLHHRTGEGVSADEPLLTIYAQKREKRSQAQSYAAETVPVRVHERGEALVELL